MDVETKLDMVKDPTSGVDNYISQFVFESCEMRHEKREKRYFYIIVLLISLLIATNLAWFAFTANSVVVPVSKIETAQSAVSESQNR